MLHGRGRLAFTFRFFVLGQLWFSLFANVVVGQGSKVNQRHRTSRWSLSRLQFNMYKEGRLTRHSVCRGGGGGGGLFKGEVKAIQRERTWCSLNQLLWD